MYVIIIIRVVHGYDKPIYGGGDGIHTAPYLKTSVNTSKGTVKVHIPLK